MDTCGFAKDNFYYYQSQWTSAPMVHILPHWNWPGREGQAIDVRTQSNCDEVELLLNGQSLGRKPMKKYSEIRWTVPYAPGTLTARAYRSGSLAAEAKVETTGPSARLLLKPYLPAIKADGQDAAVFTVSVLDAQGRNVPTAGDKVSFEISGPGKIIGVGNGDPSSHEADTFVPAATFRHIPVAGWRWNKIADPNPDNLAEEGMSYDDASWAPIDVGGDVGALGLRGKAIYRVRFNVAAADLDSPAVELVFGKIQGGVATYVNGRKVGGGVDPHTPMVYDVKALLHAGENVIAVATENWGSDGAGLSKGVSLRLEQLPAPAAWSRSAFNGLAEVIVQATRTPGPLTLTAHAEGLQDASFTLNSEAAAAKPAVP
jgi:beta-galactosidase